MLSPVSCRSYFNCGPDQCGLSTCSLLSDLLKSYSGMYDHKLISSGCNSSLRPIISGSLTLASIHIELCAFLEWSLYILLNCSFSLDFRPTYDQCYSLGIFYVGGGVISWFVWYMPWYFSRYPYKRPNSMVTSLCMCGQMCSLFQFFRG